MSGARLPGSGAAAGAAPSDLELMLYFDGELDAERAKEVESFLRSDTAARQKLAGLDLAGALLRDAVLETGSSPSADVADAVMARIAADPPPAASPDAPPAPLREAPRAGASPASSLAKKPANDNARRIFGLAAIAIAAAAALMIWARTEAPPPKAELPAPSAPIAEAPTERPAPAPPAETPSPDQDVDVGVAIAAVDFGAQTGAIFYVPSDAHSPDHTTTVVWLADEASGGK